MTAAVVEAHQQRAVPFVDRHVDARRAQHHRALALEANGALRRQLTADLALALVHHVVDGGCDRRENVRALALGDER